MFVYINTSMDCGIEVIVHTVLQTESVVNSGPAIFISPTGPNPMMVQVSPETVISYGQIWLYSTSHYKLTNVMGLLSEGFVLTLNITTPAGNKCCFFSTSV